MTKIGVYLTPIKPKSKPDVCFVCTGLARQPERIGDARCRSEEELKMKLAKYVQLHVESGTICRNCVRQLDTIVKCVNKFRANIIDSSFKRCNSDATPCRPKARRQLIQNEQVMNGPYAF